MNTITSQERMILNVPDSASLEDITDSYEQQLEKLHEWNDPQGIIVLTKAYETILNEYAPPAYSRRSFLNLRENEYPLYTESFFLSCLLVGFATGIVASYLFGNE